MKKGHWLVSVLFVFTVNAYSQVKSTEKSLDFTLGASIPIGEFGSTDFQKPSSGFAKAGPVIRISYTQFVDKHFGLTAVIYGQQNSLNRVAFENSLSQAKFNGVVVGPNPSEPGQIPTSTYSNWSLDKKSWYSAGLLLGATGEFLTNEKGNFLFITKVLFGAVFARSPELNGKSISDTAQVYVTQNSKSGFGLGYGLSAGTKYWLKHRLYLKFEVEYFGTTDLRFKDVKSTVSITQFSNRSPVSASSSTITADQTQKLSTFNLHFGVGFRL